MKGKKIAFLVEDGFEEEELTRPRKALADMGALTTIISPSAKQVKAWDHGKWSKEYDVDVHLPDAKPEDYDALVLPGGVINPDKLRRSEQAVEFIRYYLENKRPLAAICHGAQTIIETGMLKGRYMTSYPSVRTDLVNAGARWEDKEVIVDENLVTSRRPSDIPAFVNRIAAVVSGGD